MPIGNSLRASDGFTYLGVLLLMAIIGATLASTGVVWHTAQQREHEAELLFVGDQIRTAIGNYYMHNPAHEFPGQLSDLLRDPRDVGTTRYLRKVFFDPITGTQEWGLIKNSQDRIMGVYSTSEQRPIKQGNFSNRDQAFENQEKYADWKFIYIPKRHQSRRRITTIKPATTPTLSPDGNT